MRLPVLSVMGIILLSGVVLAAPSESAPVRSPGWSSARQCNERAEEERNRNGEGELRFRPERITRVNGGFARLEASIQNVGKRPLWINSRPSGIDSGIESEQQVFVSLNKQIKHSGRQVIVDGVAVYANDYVLLQPGQEKKIVVGISPGSDLAQSKVSITMCYWDRTTFARAPMRGIAVFSGPISVSRDVQVSTEKD